VEGALIVLDMGGLAPEFVSRVQLSTWFRYRAAAERTQSSILLLTQHACAKSSAELLLHLEPAEAIGDEATVFTGIRPHVEVVRRQFAQPESNIVVLRKPPQNTHFGVMAKPNFMARSPMTKAAEIYACLYVKEFPAQAVLSLRPELQNKACAVMEGEPPLQTVCSLNTKARLLGIERGMTQVEVETFPEVEILTRSQQTETAAKAILLECAGALSPRIEDRSEDVCRGVCRSRWLDQPQLEPEEDIAPGSIQPVVRLNDEGERQLEFMRWGFKKEDGRLLFNARSEGSKRQTFGRRPSTSGAASFLPIASSNGARFRRERSQNMNSPSVRASHSVWPVYGHDGRIRKAIFGKIPFAIMTVDANKTVAAVHDRQPAILNPREYRQYLEEADRHRCICCVSCPAKRWTHRKSTRK
jgi:hypothetical protein